MNFLSFEDYLLGKGLATSSVGEYSRTVRRMMRWCYANKIDPAKIEAHEIRLWAEQTVPCTWASRKGAWMAVGHWLEHVGRIRGTNPIPLPRKPRTSTPALQPDEAARLVDTAIMVGGRAGMSVVCGLYLASRASETAQLRWDGLKSGRFRFWRPKTRDWHEVPVHPVLELELGRYRTEKTSEYLFAGDRGRPHVTTTTVWGWAKRVGRIADVEVSTHQLRSTALTVALENSHDLRSVQEFAGHRDPAETSRYTRVDESRLRSIVFGIDYSAGDPDAS